MRAAGVRPSGWLWKEGGGYYRDDAQSLAARPLLPDLRRILHRRLFALFARLGNLVPGSRVLEVGCGRSAWLPFLATRLGCSVVGIDSEPYAAELARANLIGAGVSGQIVCRDAFAPEKRDGLGSSFDLVYSMGVLEHYDDVVDRIKVLATYLRPGGRILTTVPNLRGVNWLLQRLADLKTLETHVIYDSGRLARVHESAGFETIATGYAGFFDGYLSSAAGASSPLRRAIHRRLCWSASLGSQAWVRLAKEIATPELGWISPHVFYAGRPVPGRESC